ncbi:MAG: hypothetical protein QM725_12405 [Lacibacter sp.]
MLEQLLNLVKEHAGSSIVNNPAIPNERNDEAISDVTNSIAGGLQNALANGQFSDVLKMLGGKGGDMQQNPLAGQLSGGAISSLMEKFGLNQSDAGGVVSNLLPGVLQNLVSKTNDPADNSFNIQGIFNSLTGGKTDGLDLQGLLGKVGGSGFDKDGDGDTDLNDAISLVKDGASGGGLMNMVKGLFGQ